MAQMNTISPKHLHVDLLKCQKWLREKYGADAPSYMTLRRWAEADKLTSAERVSTDAGEGAASGQKRKMYSTAAVERYFLQTPQGQKLTDSLIKERTTPSKSTTADNRPDEKHVDGAALELVMDTLTHIVRVQTEQSKTLQDCMTGLSRLESLKTNLMLKYDAQVANQADIIEGLRTKLASVGKSVDLEQSILRLGILVSRVKDSVDRMATPGT